MCIRDSLEAGLLGARRVGRAGHVADDHGDARVAQVLGVRVTLAAEADDGHGLGLDQGKVGVLVVVHAVSPPVYAPPGGCTPNVELYLVTPDAATCAPPAARLLVRLGVVAEPARRVPPVGVAMRPVDGASLGAP